MLCVSCEVLVINGVICHELGCPDHWKDCTKECKWCGQEFKPEDNEQEFCSLDCRDCYYY